MEMEGHLDRVGKEGGSGLFDGCTKCENDPGVPRAAQVEGIACAKAWGPEKVERQKRVEGSSNILFLKLGGRFMGLCYSSLLYVQNI